MNKRIALAVCLVSLLPGCGKEEVLKQPETLEIEVAEPVIRQETDYEEFIGRVAAVQSVEVRAKVGGYLEDVLFTDGQLVKKDQDLYQIDPEPFKADVLAAKGQIEIWEAKKKKAQETVKRYEPLVKKGSVSKEEYETAVADLGVAEGSLTSAKASMRQAELNLQYANIKSPIVGRVSKTEVTKGNLISPSTNQALTTVVSQDPIHCYFDVDQRSMLAYMKRANVEERKLAEVRDAKISVNLTLADNSEYAHPGILDFVDNRVNPATGTVKVRAEFTNPAFMLRPGMFVRANIPGGDPYQATLVSDAAISSDQNLKFVYVVEPDQSAKGEGVVKYRAVTIGRLAKDGLRILRGKSVGKGDLVAVSELQRLRPNLKVKYKVVPMPAQKVEAPVILPKKDVSAK